MSAKNKTSNLGERIRGLSHKIEEQTKVKTRKHRIIIALGVVLMLLSSFALTRLTLQGRELDAETMTMIGRNEIEKRLPGAREKLQTHLRQQAPQLVCEGYQALIDMLPGLRGYLLEDLNTRIEVINAEFENKLVRMLSGRLMESKVRIDSKYPDMSDKEKLDCLIDDVTGDFHEQYTEAIDNLYADYSREMTRITKNIIDLRKHNPDDMTEEERIKREIIETMVQIMRREKLLPE